MRDEYFTFFRGSVIPAFQQRQMVGNLAALRLARLDIRKRLGNARLQRLGLGLYRSWCGSSVHRQRLSKVGMCEQ